MTEEACMALAQAIGPQALQHCMDRDREIGVRHIALAVVDGDTCRVAVVTLEDARQANEKGPDEFVRQKLTAIYEKAAEVFELDATPLVILEGKEGELTTAVMKMYADARKVAVA